LIAAWTSTVVTTCPLRSRSQANAEPASVVAPTVSPSAATGPIMRTMVVKRTRVAVPRECGDDVPCTEGHGGHPDRRGRAAVAHRAEQPRP
jgi:hypothetical protein